MGVTHADAAEDFWAYVADVRPAIDQALLEYLPLVPSTIAGQLNEALRYALFPGGKRLRPVLTLLGAQVVGGDAQDVTPAAVIVEYVHTSSLILDDLPCMDNGTVRRGRPCLHICYGEAIAVLAAITLLNASYGLLLNGCIKDKGLALEAHRELVECVGSHGMVAGQAADLSTDSRLILKRRDRGFKTIYKLKTAALMRLAIRLGAITSGANERQLNILSRYSELLGEVYQISDDLQDLMEDSSISKIKGDEKGAIEEAAALIDEARDLIASEFGLGRPASLLCQLAVCLKERVINSSYNSCS